MSSIPESAILYLEIAPSQDGLPPKTKRSKTSPVWKDVEEVLVNGVRKVKCKHCHQDFKVCKGNPTTTYKRHIDTCTSRKASISGKGTGPTQSILTLDNCGHDGNTLTSYKFDKDKLKDITYKMIVVHEYPFMIVEHELFRLMCKMLNPRYEPMNRQTMKDYTMKLYDSEKKKLKEKLNSVGRISLTSDLWTSNQTLGYMCLTGHFLDLEWNLQARILNFCMLPPPHTGIVIAYRIMECLCEWGIEDKVSTITLDNVSSNDSAVRFMKEQFERKGKLYFNGRIFHVRCCAHILNLIVQDGLAPIKSAIENVRESVKYITLIPSRLHIFNVIVNNFCLPTHMSLILDCPTRWNSSFHMLQRALVFKDAFPEYLKRDKTYSCLPSEDEWNRASHVCKLLEVFDETKIFSGTHYPTANLLFPEVWKIRKILDEFSSDRREFMIDMVQRMKDKFDKYWDECSFLMAIGACLDLFIEYLCMYDLYEDYVSSEASSENGESSGQSGTSNLNGKNKYRNEFKMWAKEMNIAQPSRNEVDVYLEEGIFMGVGEEDFDVLNWWKANTLKFPRLSKMARGILSIPVTTVASKSSFSAGHRVISDDRSSLSPETVQALLCLGNWLRVYFSSSSHEKVSKIFINIIIMSN
ncbi:hypothetical protein AQUCO_01900132v1 [Aquilegia coerulea]|uniref:BED-type domain-containing protein n=1 Tax=Aquilegia coerulea TaxID=218851 RepID=A0A2G5DJ14_AQUCA|nr:hypothetical protein AQUCO_01900132v1 [Aquilegia coerulea]